MYTVRKIRVFIDDTTGNTLNVQTGQWMSNVAGLGAGMDSFYEYLLKVDL